MPQLDFNTFAGLAWWLTIIFYISYVWVLIFPFARMVINSKAAARYRLYKVMQLGSYAEELKAELRPRKFP